MADRSPKFPSISLGEAIDAARLIYQREGRSTMPRLSAVKPLGYTSINGRSLSVIGALRGYGLLDGRGDDVKLSHEAITILNAPPGSDEYKNALLGAFEAPGAFATLRSKGDASPDTLRWHLIKANFRDEAADRLLKVYLESKNLVNATVGESGTPDEFTEDVERAEELVEGDTALRRSFAETTTYKNQDPVRHRERQDRDEGLALGAHERVLQSGMLSKQATFRVIVSGPVGIAEIERLIAKIEMDKDILAQPDPIPDENDGTSSA